MNKPTIIALFAILLIGCTATSDVSFPDGVQKLSEMDLQYQTSLISVPTTMEGINGYYEQLLGYRASHSFEKDIALLIDYRLKMLEAKLKYEEGWKYGKAGTTEFGFGCKSMYDKVRESATLRNESAVLGNEAVALLETFIDTYPSQAKSLNLTQRDVLIPKTIYFEIMERAEKDYRTITNLCKDKINKTQETQIDSSGDLVPTS